MKFIFSADAHLDSAFYGENTALRSGELICAFKMMVEYAKVSGIPLIALGGDLFDSPYPSPETVAAVKGIISANSDIQFIAVCGNHDPLRTTSFYNNPPDNMYVFPDTVTRFDYKELTFYGVSEKDSGYTADKWEGFHAEGRFITLSHGDLKPSSLVGTGACMCLLGHIHKSEIHTLANGVKAIYSGCLAGRGFDECGPKGFYVIDSDEPGCEFIQSSAKVYAEYYADISETQNIEQLLELLQGIVPNDNEIARLKLCGEVMEPFTIDCDRLCGLFPHFVQVKDESTLRTDFLKNAAENTLEGEFIRILSSKLEGASDEDRQKILDAIKEGVLALR